MLSAYKLQTSHQVTFSLPEMEKQPDLVKIKDTFKREFKDVTVEGNLKSKTLSVTFPKSKAFESTKDEILNRLNQLGHNAALIQSEYKHTDQVEAETTHAPVSKKKTSKRH